MEIRDIEGAIEGILFASGEPVSVERIAAVLGIDTELVSDTSERMIDRYSLERRGIRMVRLDNSLQLCSSPEYADCIRLALESRKMPQLTQPALEVLAAIAYFQRLPGRLLSSSAVLTAAIRSAFCRSAG
jgi:segregation and condensation protein B